MKSKLSHIEFMIQPSNTSFYKELFGFLGWETLHEGDGVLGVGATNDASVWFVPATSGARNDYDSPGVNHVAVGAESVVDVDAAAAYLRGKGVSLLFETPRHRPEFSSSGQTYYQVMFESPDGILFELVYTGPHA